IEKITDEVTKSRRLTGIADVKDLTDRENGIRVVIECKVGVNPQALLSDLYRLTPMEQSFGINNLVLVDGQPQTLGLKQLLEVFLRHRLEVVTRRTRYRKRKREERLHLVEGLLIALLDIDKVIRLIRASDNAQVAKGLATERRTTLIDGELKEVPAASKPAGPLEVADDPCQVILSATGIVARTAAESEEVSEGRRRSGRAKHDAVAAVVHSTARG